MLCSQRPESPRDTKPRGVLTAPESTGDRLIRKPVDDSQLERPALIRRKRPHGMTEQRL